MFNGCVSRFPNAKTAEIIWQKQAVGLPAIRHELHFHNAPEKSISDYFLNNQALSYLILRAYAPAKCGSTCKVELIALSLAFLILVVESFFSVLCPWMR